MIDIDDLIAGAGGWSGNCMVGDEDEKETKETPWEDFEDRVRERIEMELEND